ncbi:MAG: hypothetical protein AAF851_17290 [Myxococcota bacterium]
MSFLESNGDLEPLRMSAQPEAYRLGPSLAVRAAMGIARLRIVFGVVLAVCLVQQCGGLFKHAWKPRS